MSKRHAAIAPPQPLPHSPAAARDIEPEGVRGERRMSATVWVRPMGSLFAWLVLLVLFIYFFNAISTVMLGVLAAAIVSCTLSPLLKFVPWRRGLAAATLGLSLIACVGGLLLALSWPLAAPIKKEIHDWPKTQLRVNQFLDSWSEKVGMREQPTNEELTLAERRAAALQGLAGPDQLSVEARAEIERRLTAERKLTVEKLLENVGNFLAGEGGQKLFSRSFDVTFSVLVWLVFIFVGSIFLLSEPENEIFGPALRLAAPRHRAEMQAMLSDLGPRLRRWVLGTIISMTIVFCASLTGYLILGVNFAVPLAMLAGLCEIVPTVGPAVACVIACLFTAATGTGAKCVGVLSVYAAVQGIEAYFILPMIMRGAVKIHPAVTLFTVVLWGKVFGVPGLMLAIPINLTLWAIADHFIIRKYRAATGSAEVRPTSDEGRIMAEAGV